MANVVVAFADGKGPFSILAPFAQDKDLKLAVLGAADANTGVRPVLAYDNSTALQFDASVAIPAGAQPVTGITLTVKRGMAQGRIYKDGDKAGSSDSVHFNANNDTVLAGATVTLSPGGATATTDRKST